MKKLLSTVAVVALSASLFLWPANGHAQGSLTPSGAPAPTMKTADQIYAKLEARTPLNTNTTPGDALDSFIISQPGSYYLTTNLVGVSGQTGIEITANNVTLDLNGFTLLGASGGHGIYLPNASTNITVRNGNINGWGGQGVHVEAFTAVNIVLEKLNVSANQGVGIKLNGSGVIRDCNCSQNKFGGITCENGFEGSSLLITGCTVNNNLNSGIIAPCTVTGCQIENNHGAGVYLKGGAVTDCMVVSNLSSGIFVAQASSRVIGNTCIANNAANSVTQAGIYVNNPNNRIEDNHVSVSGYAGIVSAPIGGNTIVRNTVSGNGSNNYIVFAGLGSVLGPILNDSTGNLTNSSPWGNFSY